MPDYALLMTELEVLLNTVGAAATRLKARLNLIYGHHAVGQPDQLQRRGGRECAQD